MKLKTSSILVITLVTFTSLSYGSDVNKVIYSSAPSAEKINAFFPITDKWPDKIQCIRKKTKAYDKKSTTLLNHRDLYNFNFKNGTWSDFSNNGYLKYLGGKREFTVTYALHDRGGYLFKIVYITQTSNGLVANSSEVIDETVFVYWSKCKVIK